MRRRFLSLGMSLALVLSQAAPVWAEENADWELPYSDTSYLQEDFGEVREEAREEISEKAQGYSALEDDWVVEGETAADAVIDGAEIGYALEKEFDAAQTDDPTYEMEEIAEIEPAEADEAWDDIDLIEDMDDVADDSLDQEMTGNEIAGWSWAEYVNDLNVYPEWNEEEGEYQMILPEWEDPGCTEERLKELLPREVIVTTILDDSKVIPIEDWVCETYVENEEGEWPQEGEFLFRAISVEREEVFSDCIIKVIFQKNDEAIEEEMLVQEDVTTDEESTEGAFGIVEEEQPEEEITEEDVLVEDAEGFEEDTVFLMADYSGNEATIYSFLKNTLGVNTATACGILANIYCESSFNPNASCIDTNGKTSYGICQWNGGRFTALKNYCGNAYSTLEGQLNYLKYELEHSEATAWGYMQGIENSASGAYTAGRTWAQRFERCASKYYTQRAELAQNTYWPKYGNLNTLSVANGVSRADAVNWAYAQEGKSLDYDGAYGAQCVDLIKYYYAYFGVAEYAKGNGCQYATNTLPPNWTRIQNTASFVPQPGDIGVWTSAIGGGAGHVAIILSADTNSFVSMDQNWPKGSACKQVTHNYNNFWGVVRPDFGNGITLGTTKASVGTWSDTEGNNVWIGWNACEGATGYDIRIYPENGGDALYTFWHVQGTQIVTRLPAGTYQIDIATMNMDYNRWKFGERTTFTCHYNAEGMLNVGEGGPKLVHVYGWAFDRDNINEAVGIDVYMDGPEGEGKFLKWIKASKYHDGVADYIRETSGWEVGDYHGFDEYIPVEERGEHTIYVYALNGGKGAYSTLIGTRTVYIADGYDAEGKLNLVEGGEKEIHVVGYAFDKDNVNVNNWVDIYVDDQAPPSGNGKFVKKIPANVSRPEVSKDYQEKSGGWIIGDYHGFDSWIEIDDIGEHTVYVYALNLEDTGGTYSTLIGQQTVTVHDPVVVKYNPNGGAGNMDVQKASRYRSNLAEKNLFEKKGYQFIGWHMTRMSDKRWYCGDNVGWLEEKLTAGGETKYNIQDCALIPDVSNLSEGESIVLFAQWKEIEHVWGEDSRIINEATCTEDGIIENTCIYCDETQTEIVPALGHTYSMHQITKAATCTEPGTKTYTCFGCGKTYTESIPATGHNYGDRVVEPACATRGYTVHTCSNCGDSYTDQYTEELGHDYDDGVVTVPATAETDGLLTHTCSRCGDARTEVIPATGHKYDSGVITKEATCMEPGIRTYTCTDCGQTYTEEIPATGHDYRDTVVSPDCTKRGYTVHTCTICGDSYRDAYTQALGHRYDAGEIMEDSTCTEEGTRIYTCTVCKQQYTESIAPAGHHYTDTVTEPTCTRKGYTTHTCSACHASYRDTYTDALGHSYGAGEMVEEPTCTEDGQKSYTCSACGNSILETVPALGHQFEDTMTEATCTRMGYTTHTCHTCGYSYANSYIPAKGHTWDEGAVAEEATCVSAGSRVYTCTACGETKLEKIPADKDHHIGGVVIRGQKEATKEYDGYTGDTYCEACGQKLSEGTAVKYVPSQDETESEKKPEETESETPEETENGKTPAEMESEKAQMETESENSPAETENEKTPAETESGNTQKETEGEESTEAHVHTWDKGKVTKDATYTTAGTRTYTCTDCGETMTEVIPKAVITDPEGDPADAASTAGTEKAITAMGDAQEPAGSSFAKIQVKSAKQTKNSITVSWNKVKGADGYIIYGNKCGKGVPFVRLAKQGKTSFTYKKLKKGTYYKFSVVAYKVSGGKETVIASAKTVHVATKGGKVTNVARVKLNASKKTLKEGGAFKLKVTTVKQSKKLTLKTHRKVKFESSNTKVATVDKKGKIRAKKKGTCYIYAYTQNGVYARIKITVRKIQ